MKEKKFKFRIVGVTHKSLGLDNKTIHSRTHYELYEKVRWVGWIQYYKTGDTSSLAGEFTSIEEAKQYALKCVQNWLEDQEREQAKKKLKKELKTTVEVVYEGKVSAKEPTGWSESKECKRPYWNRQPRKEDYDEDYDLKKKLRWFTIAVILITSGLLIWAAI